MLASPVCITPQQARVLLPLLQQIASGESTSDYVEKAPSGCTSRSGSGCSSGSSGSSPLFYPTPTRVIAASTGQVGGYSTDKSESACKYSSDELFQSKTRNSKSSSAHSFCHTIVREAAKSVGLWDTAPLLEEIPPDTLKRFRETAYSLCPVLKSDPAKLKRLLGDSMMNRRAYLRRTKRKSPTTTKGRATPKYRYGRKGSKPTAKTLFMPRNERLATSKETPMDKSVLKPGCDVIVKDSSATVIAKGMFINKENDMYGQVLLKENMSKKEDEINLPKAVGQKFTFQQLRKHDVFQWKLSNLAADVIVSDPEPQSEEDSPSSGEESLSIMEKKQLASIRRNKLIWDEIDKGNISFDEEGELLFYGHASNLEDYVPSVEHDGATGESSKKTSSKKAPPRSNLKTVEPPSKKACPRSKQVSSGRGQVKDTVPLGRDGESPKKPESLTKKKVCPSSKQSPSKKCKTLPSPKKNTTPKNTRKSPSKVQDSRSDSLSPSDQKHKASRYWTYVSDDDADHETAVSQLGRGKRERKIKIRSDDDIM